jgi:hypothetical protein
LGLFYDLLHRTGDVLVPKVDRDLILPCEKADLIKRACSFESYR